MNRHVKESFFNLRTLQMANSGFAKQFRSFLVNFDWMIKESSDKYLNPSIKRMISSVEVIGDICKSSTRGKIRNNSSIIRRVTDSSELWIFRVRIVGQIIHQSNPILNLSQVTTCWFDWKTSIVLVQEGILLNVFSVENLPSQSAEISIHSVF